MDPNFNGVWSASEIDRVKSATASLNTTSDTNQNQNDIVEELPNKLPKKKRQAAKSWTNDEHQNFLCGLQVFGRGNWKNISRYFVPTKTPIQICSHAQKYFQRNQCTTRKLRFSINDVGLCDIEPRVHNNSSSSETLGFDPSAYNTNYYDFEGHVFLNASQGSSRHVDTWATGLHTVASSSVDPAMVQSNSHGWEALAFTGGANTTNYYHFDGQNDGMNNLAGANQASNNQVATWTSGQQTTASSSVAPATVQNTYPSWEVLSFPSSAYNSYYDIDGQQVAMNNTIRGQP